jgi:GT2 family glycosyltransferase
MKRIAICVPVVEQVSTEFLGSFLNVIFGNMKKYEFVVSFSVLQPIDLARNELIERALKHNSDYIWFIDSDMILEEGILDNLVNMNKDIASALYFMRSPPYKPIVKVIKDEKFFIVDRISLNQILEVDAVGLGCCLIKREVFEKMLEKNDNKPIFEFKKHKLSNNEIEILSEDTAFCFKAKKTGFKIFVNTGLICKHIGKSFIDENFYNFYLNLENKDKQ